MVTTEIKPALEAGNRHEQDYEEDESTDIGGGFSDDSVEDPTFNILEETQSKLCRMSLKKSRPRIYKEEIVGVEIPELGEKDGKCFENVEKLIKDGQLEKLKVDQCKVYLRKYGLRLTGNKVILIGRIREHLEVKDGVGEKTYPASSFVLNCKGDACTGDVVMFEQNVYEMYNIASRSATGPSCGIRTVAGRIVKESYGAAKQQHTFTIEVLWSKGEKPLPPLHPLLIKGRNLYRLMTKRQRWEDEEERRKVLQEKHTRGSRARCSRENRVLEKEIMQTGRMKRTSQTGRQGVLHKKDQSSIPRNSEFFDIPHQDQRSRIFSSTHEASKPPENEFFKIPHQDQRSGFCSRKVEASKPRQNEFFEIPHQDQRSGFCSRKHDASKPQEKDTPREPEAKENKIGCAPSGQENQLKKVDPIEVQTGFVREQKIQLREELPHCQNSTGSSDVLKNITSKQYCCIKSDKLSKTDQVNHNIPQALKPENRKPSKECYSQGQTLLSSWNYSNRSPHVAYKTNQADINIRQALKHQNLQLNMGCYFQKLPLLSNWDSPSKSPHAAHRYHGTLWRHHREECLHYMNSPSKSLHAARRDQGTARRHYDEEHEQYPYSPRGSLHPQHYAQQLQQCHYYRQGRCYFAENCKYLHGDR